MADSVISKDIISMKVTATKNVAAGEKSGHVTAQFSIPAGYKIIGCTVNCGHSNIIVCYLGYVNGTAYISYFEMSNVQRDNESFEWNFILEKI